MSVANEPVDGAPVDLDDVMTDLMQGHLDDVTGASSSSHNSWKQGYASSKPGE
ncbi:hypothetical protein BH10PSE14_BH10PSE14_22220 [soil metagenome]